MVAFDITGDLIVLQKGDLLTTYNWQNKSREIWSTAKGKKIRILKEARKKFRVFNKGTIRKYETAYLNGHQNHQNITITKQLNGVKLFTLRGMKHYSDPEDKFSGNESYLFRSRLSDIEYWDLGAIAEGGMKTKVPPTGRISKRIFSPLDFQVEGEKNKRDARLRAGVVEWGPSHYGGKIVFAYDSGLISLLDVPTGTIVWTNQDVIGEGWQNLSVREQRQNKCNKKFVTSTLVKYVIASCHEKTIAIDMRTGEAVWKKNDLSFTSVIFNKTETIAYLGRKDGTVQAVEMATGDILNNYQGARRPESVLVDKKNSSIAIGLSEEKVSFDLTSIQLFKLGNKNKSRSRRSYFQSRKGNLIGIISQNKIDVYRWPENRLLQTIETENKPFKAQFSPDETSIYVSLVTQERTLSILTMKGPKTFGYIQQYDLATGRRRTQFIAPANDFKNRLAFDDFALDPQGRWLIGIVGIGTNHIGVMRHAPYAVKYRLDTGQVLKTFRDDDVYLVGGVDFSGDGSHYVLNYAKAESRDRGGRIRVHDSQTDRVRHRERFNSRVVGRPYFLDDGRSYIYETGNNVLRLGRNFKASRPFIIGNKSYISSISRQPIEGAIATSSYDGTVRLWDKNTGEERLTLVIFGPDEWLAITPEGFFTGTENSAKKIRVTIDRQQNLPIDNFYNALYRPDLVFRV